MYIKLTIYILKASYKMKTQFKFSTPSGAKEKKKSSHNWCIWWQLMMQSKNNIKFEDVFLLLYIYTHTHSHHTICPRKNITIIIYRKTKRIYIFHIQRVVVSFCFLLLPCIFFFFLFFPRRHSYHLVCI